MSGQPTLEQQEAYLGQLRNEMQMQMMQVSALLAIYRLININDFHVNII